MSLAPFTTISLTQGCLKSRYSRRNPGRALGFRCDACAKPTGKWSGENLQLPKLTMIMFLLAKSKFREFFITKKIAESFTWYFLLVLDSFADISHAFLCLLPSFGVFFLETFFPWYFRTNPFWFEFCSINMDTHNLIPGSPSWLIRKIGNFTKLTIFWSRAS